MDITDIADLINITYTYRFRRGDEVIEIAFDSPCRYVDDIAEKKLDDVLFERGEDYNSDEWELI